jgi:RPA family protein
MWKCETIKDEVKRIRKVKKAREIKRLADWRNIQHCILKHSDLI